MLPFSLALVLVALLTSPAAAEEKSACSLLTSSDIEAVVGGKPSASQPLQFDDIPTGTEDREGAWLPVGRLYHGANRRQLVWRASY